MVEFVCVGQMCNILKRNQHQYPCQYYHQCQYQCPVLPCIIVLLSAERSQWQSCVGGTNVQYISSNCFQMGPWLWFIAWMMANLTKKTWTPWILSSVLGGVCLYVWPWLHEYPRNCSEGTTQGYHYMSGGCFDQQISCGILYVWFNGICWILKESSSPPWLYTFSVQYSAVNWDVGWKDFSLHLYLILILRFICIYFSFCICIVLIEHYSTINWDEGREWKMERYSPHFVFVFVIQIVFYSLFVFVSNPILNFYPCV